MEHFGKDLEELRDVPFFPTVSGTAVHKVKFVDMVEDSRISQSQLKLPLRTPADDRAFGGHVWGVREVKWLVRLGMDSATIKSLARWLSDMILEYDQEAPWITWQASTKIRSY